MSTSGKEGQETAHLVLDSPGLHLICEDLCPGLLRLGLVNVLHQNSLVLEDVTLGFLVERVISACGGI